MSALEIKCHSDERSVVFFVTAESKILSLQYTKFTSHNKDLNAQMWKTETNTEILFQFTHNLQN